MAPQRRPRPQRLALHGSIWIAAGDESLGGHGRMALLRSVAEHGSITHGARACGMSYKGAWEAIEAMNTLAGAPLVERSAGGRGGGGTRLTERGRALVERFAQLQAVHHGFVRQLDRACMDFERPFSLLEALNMRTSARNQWVGTVSAVRSGAVNDEVELALPGGARLTAIVTHASIGELALRTQQTAIALVQAASVLLATALDDGVRLSARNRLDGTVRAVTPGAANAEVLLQGDAGVPVVAIVPQASVAELGLAVGVRAAAFVKASDVVLAVAG